ncbi:Na/Pi cotransporter family protein [Ectothiorhodospiraceae bacterium 2226]|nr:Na/Pi cotransporter family protein [Ectothiorhodospiraceae bacterium 2226]
MSGTGLLVNFIGGVALLVWGVRMVRTGMMRAFGARLRQVLAACTGNRFAAAGTGLGVTAALQSSAATALIVSPLVARGMLGGGVALSVMLGADIGSALVAQVFALDLRGLAPLAVAVGVITFMTARADRARNIGRIVIGVGLMLLALGSITAASAPLRDAQGFGVLLAALEGEPLLAVLFAAMLTWLAHSSLAMVLLVAALAASGALPPALALVLVLGVNVGGAIAPYTLQAGAPASARRVPLGNLLMRGAGALALLPLIPAATEWLLALDPSPGRAPVHAHLAFNLMVAALFLPFTDRVARATARLLPDAPVTPDPAAPQHLDAAALDTPSEALACAARECLRLGDLVDHMLQRSIQVLEHDDTDLLKQVGADDDEVDRLHEAIKHYLIQLSRTHMTLDESRRCMEIIRYTVNLEHVGDIIEKNLMEIAAKKARHGYRFSPEGLAQLKAIHARVGENLQLSLNVLLSRDPLLARRLLDEKGMLRALEQAAVQAHFERLRAGEAESIENSAVYLDVIRDLKRINGHLAAVAHPLASQEGDAPAAAVPQRELGDRAAPRAGLPVEHGP